ncbi:hypothetical protein FKX85_08315 [Echinicola soli]|uniref:Uncharacterized protein n=2 Tax=Echinicola soli TaxID=2591634 RepID=A0A514CNZ6_9BACT|nr:hypothetical protein FKX85_08315 [Echinicola soli]
MENNRYSVGEEIFVADFNGNILASFIKDGDTRDTYGHIMAPLVIDGKNSFMAYAFNGFMCYDFSGNLISRIKLVDFHNPNYRRIAMGRGLLKLGEKYLYMDLGSRDFEYGSKDFFDNYYAMSLLDPKTGRTESIIPLPETSIFRKGNFFFRYAWEPTFDVEDNQLFVVFGLEPTIYVFENQSPFSLISKIPIKLSNYHYFKGAKKYNRDDIRFYGHKRSSGKILNIKKIKDYFLLAYFPGYDHGDVEESFSDNISPGFWERMRKKYPIRIAILDSHGKVVNDFVPDGLWATSMLVRNGELWMLGKPDGEIERDYFQLFKVGLKIE